LQQLILSFITISPGFQSEFQIVSIRFYYLKSEIPQSIFHSFASRKNQNEEERMEQTIKVGIIGDYNPDLRFHKATNEALTHASSALSWAVDFQWVPTHSLEDKSGQKILEAFDALWCSPGSPYKSMGGALQGIRFARERGRPFIGT
jgi:CTP synthase (UTP-ammonia lyase)